MSVIKAVRQSNVSDDRDLMLLGNIQYFQGHDVLALGGHLGRLHGGLVDAVGSREHGERVAREGALGEDVADLVMEEFHRR